jgi:microcompartment protein CcmL/EutN
LIVAAVASVRSAYKNGSEFNVDGPISKFVVPALKYVRPPDDVSAVIPPTPVTSLFMFTGAEVPSGKSTESPFCGHGSADAQQT